MAEEHQVEARIQLRYDTYENWMNSSTILKTGEAAICAFKQKVIDNSTPENTPPAIGIKIGDGQHRFSELPWIQGIAADVYNWAKQVQKPIYTAQEIEGLQSFVESLVQGDVDITIAPRIYSLVRGQNENSDKWYLRYKENNENASWIIDTSAAIDLTDLTKLVNWVGDDLTDERYPTLLSRTYEQIAYIIGELDTTDTPQDNHFVTAVSKTDGQLIVERAQPSFSDLRGTVTVEQGGTGRKTLTEDYVLVGNGTDPVKLIPIAEEITDNNHLVPNYLIKEYVDDKVAGLAGAMHFIGQATVNPGSGLDPQIPDYDFAQAQPGDVILYNYQEFVWDGSGWHLLGDEGSYILKGKVKDSDIIADANIDQSKIKNLSEDLQKKVNKVEGKVLSSNDYTNEEKAKLSNIQEYAQQNLIEHIYINDIEQVPNTYEGSPKAINIPIRSLTPAEEQKLGSIEDNAQVNIIEHVFLNDQELSVTSVEANGNTYPKSVNIPLTIYTDDEKQKLAGIEPGAEVNKIESISVNGVNQQPEKGNVEITIPENTIEQIALNNEVLVPDQNNKRVNIELAPIAATGSIYDVNNTTFSWDNYLILRCGNATNLVN